MGELIDLQAYRVKREADKLSVAIRPWNRTEFLNVMRTTLPEDQWESFLQFCEDRELNDLVSYYGSLQ